MAIGAVNANFRYSQQTHAWLLNDACDNRLHLMGNPVKLHAWHQYLNSWLQTRKSISQLLAAAQTSKLTQGRFKKQLYTFDLILLGVGAIIGAGIFTTIGTAALGDAERLGAGPSLMLSFVITALCCSTAALCYAEFAAMVPVSGSAYTYSYAALGEAIAWMIGWDLMLEYAISNVAVAVSWANYCRVFFSSIGIQIPWYLCTDYRTASRTPELLATAPHILGVAVVLNMLAFSVTAFLTLLLVWGVRESARVNALMVLVKLAVLFFFAVCVLRLVTTEQLISHWQPFFPNGFKGTLTGSAVVFFAFIGFDTLSTVAEECHQPSRSIPLGIFGALLCCTFIYVIIAGLFTGALPQQVLQMHSQAAVGEPLTWVLGALAPHQSWLISIVAAGAVVAQTATLLVYQLGQPRIFLSMARDGLLPPFFARIHPRFGTPHVTTMLTGILVALASTFVTIDELIDLTNIGTLAAFLVVCLGIPILRITDPQRTRPFKVPFGAYLIPLLGAFSNGLLLWYLPSSSWWRFLGWLCGGLSIYIFYGYRHSILGRQQGRRPYCSLWDIAWGTTFLMAALAVFWHAHFPIAVSH